MAKKKHLMVATTDDSGSIITVTRLSKKDAEKIHAKEIRARIVQ